MVIAKYSLVVNRCNIPPLYIYIYNFFYVNMPVPCTFAWLYLFNPGCPCLGSSTLDVLMSPDIGRNNLFLLITDRVHTVGFNQR